MRFGVWTSKLVEGVRNLFFKIDLACNSRRILHLSIADSPLVRSVSASSVAGMDDPRLMVQCMASSYFLARMTLIDLTYPEVSSRTS